MLHPLRWYSICSMHATFNPECSNCRIGTWTCACGCCKAHPEPWESKPLRLGFGGE